MSLFDDKPEYHSAGNSFSDYFREDNDYRKEFCRIMAPELVEFTGAIKGAMPEVKDLTMNTVWTQRYQRKESMMTHSHGPRGFSAVLYTEFVKGEHQATVLQGYSNHPITQEVQIFVPEVQEGDMIIFPSSMPHFADASQSDLTRTIMSFNLDIVYYT